MVSLTEETIAVERQDARTTRKEQEKKSNDVILWPTDSKECYTLVLCIIHPSKCRTKKPKSAREERERGTTQFETRVALRERRARLSFPLLKSLCTTRNCNGPTLCLTTPNSIAFAAPLASKVNILVEELQPDGSPRYLVFEQSKYGLDGSSLAVVGGLIDERDTDPAAAAARELLEETGRKAAALVPLGRFRADCNRGGGYVSAFLARNTVLVPPAERALSDDLEPQAVVMLSASELRAALVAGRFQEVKWSNTVALGLLAAEAL